MPIIEFLRALVSLVQSFLSARQVAHDSSQSCSVLFYPTPFCRHFSAGVSFAYFLLLFKELGTSTAHPLKCRLRCLLCKSRAGYLLCVTSPELSDAHILTVLQVLSYSCAAATTTVQGALLQHVRRVARDSS